MFNLWFSINLISNVENMLITIKFQPFMQPFITHLISVEIMSLNKCKQWGLRLDLLTYYVRLNVMSSHLQKQTLSQYVNVTLFLFANSTFIMSIQGEMLCWFHIHLTNFACWDSCIISHLWLSNHACNQSTKH